MSSGIPALEQAYHGFFVVLLVILAVLFFMCLIRAVVGPRMADRIVAVNMLGTMVIVAIATIAVMLKEGYLVDICLIYAMISFLAVIILTKVYMGVYTERKKKEEKLHARNRMD
ncbi:MAG: sodium:proton antiporter [Lachnospiraceae bacterium]|nr:sodium:proton antiporter [Lachnospiraceae bacterium]